jgi:gliding motility-associated-like protein
LTSNAYSGGPVSYYWTTPIGLDSTTSPSLIRNPVTSADSGTYSLYVTVNGCPSLSSGSVLVQVDVPPAAPMPTFSLPNPCAGDTLFLFATGIPGHSYQWFGPNGFSSTLQNPIVPNASTLANGTYTVTVTNGACTQSGSVTVSSIVPVPATPTVATNAPVCEGSPLFFSSNAYAGASVSYVWTTPIGTLPTNSAGLIRNPAATADSGIYSLQVVVNGCTSLVSAPVLAQVDARPQAPAPTFSLTNACVGDTLNLFAIGNTAHTYTWSGPNGFSSTLQNPVLSSTSILANGTYGVTVSNGLCTNSGTVNVSGIVPIPATPTISSNGPVCQGGTLSLSSNAYSGGPVSYFWTTPQGPDTTASAALIITPADTLDRGTYSLFVTVNGCASLPSGNLFVQVDGRPVAPAPTYTLSSPCEGDTLFLAATGNPAHTYLWTGPNGYSSTLQNPVLTATTIAANGTYTVSVSNGTCSTLGTVTVNTIVPIPATPTISAGGSVCAGSGFTFTTPPRMGNAVQYIWTTPTGLDTTSIASYSVNTATQADSGFYAVQVEVDGCASLPSGAALQVVEPIPATPTILANHNPVCAGDTLIFSTPDSAAAYVWAGPNGFSSSSRFPVAVYPVSNLNAGVYTLSVMENGCYSALATDTIVVNAQPAAPTIVGPGTICAGDTLRFSTGSNCGTYQWIGPLGSAPGTLANPYLSTSTPTTGIPQGDVAYLAGNWQVHCIDNNGCQSPLSNTVSVTITPRPQLPSLNATGPHCAGANAQLFANGPSGASYAWSGVGGFNSSAQNPTLFSVSVADSGTYSAVSLLNGCASDTAYIDLVVNAIPAAPQPGANGPVCSGAPIQLSANATAATYAWTGPNGFTSNQQNPVIPSASAANDGFYFLTLTQNGCTSASGNVQVQVIGSVTTPLVTSNSPLCEGQMLNLLTNTYTGPSVQYIWTGPGGLVDTTSSAVYVDTNATTAEQGFYSVTVLVGGCSSLGSAPVFVTVHAIPGPPAIFTAPTVCEGDPITLATNVVADAYLWTGPNGFFSTAQQPPAIVAGPQYAGTYTLQVTDNGCTSIDSVGTATITVNATPATPIIFSNSPVCIGDSLVVTTFGGSAGYVWTVPLGTTVTTTDSFLVIYPAQLSDGGAYQVAQVQNGCTSPASTVTNVVVNDIPNDVAFAGEDFAVCENPGVVRLDATASSNSGIWTTNSTVTIVSPTQPTTQITGFVPGGTYTFYWTVSNGACGGYSADSVVVHVLLPPDAITDYIGITENNLLENQSLVLNDTLFGQDYTLTILENPEHGQVTLNQNLSINYTPFTDYAGPDQMLYEVCLEGCPDMCDTAYVLLEIGPELIIYDIITPNGDGDNEFFTIIGLDNFPQNELYIYNRWGNEVFAAQNYQNDWAGTWDGKPLPDGTYFFVLLNGADGELIRKGYVTLHR